MASFDSVQMAKLNATPVQHVRSDEHGRVRRATFAWESTSTPAAADTINLCKLPPGARVMGGWMFWEANTATATLGVGTASTANLYTGTATLLTNVPTQAPAAGGAGGRSLFGDGTGGTIAAPVIGEVIASARTVIGTVAVATLAASKRIYGYIDYLGVE
jgi:hypothetical protein